MRSAHAVALRVIAALAITISSTAAYAQSTTQPNPAADALTAARASLNKVLNAPSPNGEAFKKLAELKTHYIALEKAASTASPEWSTHYSAIDRLVSELIGSAASSAPKPVGTSGRVGAETSAALDASLRTNLQDFRTHLTAFSAAMSAVAPAKSASTAASATAAAPAKLPPDPPEATTTAAAPSATVAAPPPLAAPITPAPTETSPPDAAAAQTATIEGKPSTPAQPAPSAVDTSGDVDRLAAMIDNALTIAPDSSGKISIDRSMLEQIKKEIEALRARK